MIVDVGGKGRCPIVVLDVVVVAVVVVGAAVVDKSLSYPFFGTVLLRTHKFPNPKPSQ